MINRPRSWWLAKAQAEPEVPIAAGATTPNACYMEYRPTFAERFWRKAGYRYQLQELPEETSTMPGWAMTRIYLHFSFMDRVRLLISGNLHLDVRQAMSESVTTVVSSTSIDIMRPGERIDTGS